MYTYEEIQHVHLEPTTRCNAGCPMCARNACGVTSSKLGRTELSREDVQAIFPVAFLQHINGFDLCGAYGDPAITRDIIDIVTYIRHANPGCLITLYTNGGMHTPDWWRRLAQSLDKPGRVVFAIDGTAETLHIYRRGVHFNKVIENARAFIDAGGEARWEFLVFRHNEHEIETARKLSEEIGFREFSLKRTGRFLEPTYEYIPEYQGYNDLNRFPVYDAKGAIVNYLEPPDDPALVNKTTLHFSELLNHYSSLDELFSTTPIHCLVKDSRSVFVGAQGYVFPCCWTYVQATRCELFNFPASADRQVHHLVQETGGFERINALSVGLQAAVEGPLFAAIEASWSCASIAEGRLKICARACGVDFPAYSDQFESQHLLPRGLQAKPRVTLPMLK